MSKTIADLQREVAVLLSQPRIDQRARRSNHENIHTVSASTCSTTQLHKSTPSRQKDFESISKDSNYANSTPDPTPNPTPDPALVFPARKIGHRPPPPPIKSSTRFASPVCLRSSKRTPSSGSYSERCSVLPQ